MSRIDNFDFKFNKIKDNPDNRVLLKKLFRLEDELKNIEDNFNINDITHLFRPNQIRQEKQNIYLAQMHFLFIILCPLVEKLS